MPVAAENALEIDLRRDLSLSALRVRVGSAYSRPLEAGDREARIRRVDLSRVAGAR